MPKVGGVLLRLFCVLLEGCHLSGVGLRGTAKKPAHHFRSAAQVMP
jgi:hypothetical protein